MNPEDVPTEWVEKGKRGLIDAAVAEAPNLPVEAMARAGAENLDRTIRVILAAVLPEIQAQAVAPLLAVHERYFNTEVDAYTAAEDFASEDAWRFDRDFREAARLTTTEEPTDG